MKVTAYTDGKESTGKTPGMAGYGETAISTPTHPVHTHYWYTIASPNLPIGTRIYIPYFSDMPNKGYFTVEDRGGGLEANQLDVYFGYPARDKTALPRAMDFGVQKLVVYIQIQT